MDSEELRQKKSDGAKLSRPKGNSRYTNASSMCLSLLRMNYENSDIIERLKDEYGYSDNSARKLVDKVKKKLKQLLERKYDKIAEENINRLEAIIDETYEEKRYNEMLKAIDTLNKIGGVYTTKVDINGTLNQDFVIKIRED